uniref:Nuclease HARBI1 n=1 Tax=Romanomermis culicivorax TaxID=13658 RepID=A0A915KFB3_ROMCU
MQRFRFDWQGILNITELIRGDIKSTTHRNRAIPAILQVCIALRYYFCGTFQMIIGDTESISQPTACRSIHKVTAAILSLATVYPFSQEEIKFKK